MHTGYAVDPRGRHVALGERELDVVEGVEVHLVAAPPLRLQHAEKARAPHVGDGLVRNSALPPPLERACGQRRNQRLCTGDDLRRLGYPGCGSPRGLHGTVRRRYLQGSYSAAVRFLRALRSRHTTSMSVDMMSPNVR